MHSAEEDGAATPKPFRSSLANRKEHTMETSERLSDAEIDIMKVLWKTGEALSAREIVKSLSENRAWKTQTAHVLLSRLEQKGFIFADRSGYSHKFSAAVSEEEYLVSESVQLCDKVGKSVPSMVATLIVSHGLSANDITELSEILENQRRELGKRG